MTSEGPNSPGTMANINRVSYPDWTDVNNAKVEDASVASLITPSAFSGYLAADNFGFSIPALATIVGIEVEAKTNKVINSGSGANSLYAQLVKAGTRVGNQKSGFAQEGALTYRIRGDSSELWGISWSVDDINNSDFGVQLFIVAAGDVNVTWNVDHIRITVYYTWERSTFSKQVNLNFG